MREMNWIWRIGAPLVHAVLRLCFRMRVEGIHQVPSSGAVILAANHVSVLDGPVLAAVTGTHRRRATRFLVAAEIYETGWAWILRQARQVPVRRGTGDTAALETAVRAVREGGCLGIFPEGRVNEDPGGGMQRFRSGISRVAVPTASPVIPVGMWGAQVAWPKDGLRWRMLLRRPVFAVVYGDPVFPPRPGSEESPAGFRGRLAEAIGQQLQRARAVVGDLP